MQIPMFYKAFISMSEQCGLSIGSETTFLNLHMNGIVLRRPASVSCHNSVALYFMTLTKKLTTLFANISVHSSNT